MNGTQQGAIFQYTKTEKVALYFAIVFCGFSAIAFLAGVAVAVFAVTEKRPDQWFAIAVSGGVAVYLLLLVRLQAKYRHVFRYEYEVLKSGISVTYGDQTEFVPWNDVEAAEYMPVPSVFRLSSSRLTLPIVLFALSIDGRNTPAAVRNRMAKSYIRDGLSERLLRKWIPW